MPEFDWITTLSIIAGVIAVVMPTVGYLTLSERKISAWIQDRVGPNRVGPLGLLQPLADGGKFFLKEAPIPSHVDKIFFLLAPAVSMATALVALAVVPWGGTTPAPAPVKTVEVVNGAERPIATAVETFEKEQIEHAGKFQSVIMPGLDIGLLYVFAVGSLAVYGVILGGWASDNKYSLLGALRSSAQIISYEIPLGMSVVGILLFTGSLNLEVIQQWQKQHGWFIAFQPLAFLLFMTSVYAECNRLPFDLPEAEQELVGGYLTEYGALNFGMFMIGEFTHMITTSLLMSLCFFGGYTLFGLEDSFTDPIAGFVLKAVILGAKVGFFLFLYQLVRWTIPRFRFDQLMSLAWKVMIPLSLLHLLGAMLVRQFHLSNWVLTGISVGLFVGAGLLAVAIGAGPNNAPRKRLPTKSPVPVGVN
jgi:NADH-quinone oxidoreductase subunit H